MVCPAWTAAPVPGMSVVVLSLVTLPVPAVAVGFLLKAGSAPAGTGGNAAVEAAALGAAPASALALVAAGVDGGDELPIHTTSPTTRASTTSAAPPTDSIWRRFSLARARV